ncbi:thioredoxin family protein [Candidatus Methylacidithermus pantelleriae]|uniref:PPO candidate 1 n=1 Tax=Candidatus Methylacidithermus pantelleriae TaxID=2744239 RepID=A0A8J2BW30_9BACT|nr:thioredoxin family protein [Candidatus Methylacidithermus pantelleriae]CAF0703753.1 PPO candidate 1 [Candidatus Methylacidithermus pantelleriae]
MAATRSLMLPLGTPCPDFALPDPSGKIVRRDDFQGAPALLVMFLCNHCPYVKHIRHHLAEFCRNYQKRGVAIVGINSNDPQRYPEDSPERMAEEIKLVGYPFPYLFDESQEVAKAFRAACTPDFFLFDQDRKLVYRGQYDDSRPGNGIPVTGHDLARAIDALLEGRPIPQDQKPSLGCSIKWKPGNEPDYL